MATFRISLHVSQEIEAEDEEIALDIFWEDLLRNQEEEEPLLLNGLPKGVMPSATI